MLDATFIHKKKQSEAIGRNATDWSQVQSAKQRRFMDDAELTKIVEERAQKLLIQIAQDAETIGKTHPEITLLQFAAVIRLSAANVGEDWSIERFENI